jgi:hypothetical protein
VSPLYRDDRPSLLASLDELRRENEDLRAENFTLRVLADPPASQSSMARMQGALTATLVVSVAMLAAAVVTREPTLWRAPAGHRAPTTREFPDDLPTPERALAVTPPTTPACAPPTFAPEPASAPEEQAPPSPDALRAALLPLQPALLGCLRGAHGAYHLEVTLDAPGAVREAVIRARADARLTREMSLCAQGVAGRLRLDVEAPTALRYSLRLRGDELRVRRVRRL